MLHIGSGVPRPKAGSGVKPDRIANGLAAGFANGFAFGRTFANRVPSASKFTFDDSVIPSSDDIPGRTKCSMWSGITLAPDSRAIDCAAAGDAVTASALTPPMSSETRALVDFASDMALANEASFGATTM